MKSKNRFSFIDALRGLAALSIVLFHVQGCPVAKPFCATFPQFIQIALKNGYLGVEVFFVLSGFIIAYSFKNARVDLKYFGNFILRRLIRLSPPYWVAIAFVVVVRYVSNFILTDRVASLPSWQQLLAQIFYLQDILKLGNISAVFWTLSIEVQFYIIFCILLSTTQRLEVAYNFGKHLKGLTIILVFGSVSLLLATWPLGLVSENLLPGLLFPYFYMFLLGVFTWWTLEKRLPHLYFICYLTLIFTGATFNYKADAVFATLITAIIYLVGRIGKLKAWLNIDWLQYLGQISYSLYLTHVTIVLPLLNVGYRITQYSLIGSFIWISIALIMSLGIAHCLWHFVEKPSIEISQRLKLALPE